MSKNGKVAEPVFDFTRMPRRRFLKRFSALIAKTSTLSVSYETLQDDLAAMKADDARLAEMTEEDADDPDLVVQKAAVRRRQIEAMQKITATSEQMQAMGQAQEALLASVLVSVPESWWLPDAPEDERNFEDAENLDWLADGRFEELMEQLRASPKNLPTLSSSPPNSTTLSSSTPTRAKESKKLN